MQRSTIVASRRSVLIGSGSLLALASTLGFGRATTAKTLDFKLVAKPAAVAIAGSKKLTDVWSYSGLVPGPEIRVRQGDRLRVVVENQLPEETTVHWHGIRLQNAMDGVPHVTQHPIQPGAQFTYEFECPDAGTYWYHPHVRSFEQVARGLFGALIVEEKSPLLVDREQTLVLSDWRLRSDGSVVEDFGHLHDLTHAGRIGNVVTVNGVPSPELSVTAGERIRLRIVNAATARIFGLKFERQNPVVVSLDGHAIEPYQLRDELLVIGPGMRADVVIDMEGEPGASHGVVDRFYRGRDYELLTFKYTQQKLASGRFVNSPKIVPATSLPQPDVVNAVRHDILMAGGMMGGLRSAVVDGKETDIRSMIEQRLMWALNGVAAKGHAHAPSIQLVKGQSCVLNLINETGWPHPMHLHGHVFLVLSRNRKPVERKEWRDTVLIPARETAEIAFLADNPGDWMFHCHVLDHDAGGMKTTIRVS
jgi:FtsP/CotA-like multicopper oxidase with cupredoxin domain